MDEEIRKRHELVGEEITLTRIVSDYTIKRTARWIAWGRYDGTPVKVTLWSEDISRFSVAGYPLLPWYADHAADGFAVSIPVILDWKQSCGYVVREVIKVIDPTIMNVNGAALQVGHIVRCYAEGTTLRWTDRAIEKIDLNRDGKPQMWLAGHASGVQIGPRDNYVVQVELSKEQAVV